MAPHLILRFEAPMQAWGAEAVDPRRPSGAYPRRSALSGILGNALGWRHRDVDRLNELQDALRFAAREDRAPERMWDYQTADLSRLSGFGRWGPTKPGGAFSSGTHILKKEYLADARFTVSIGVASEYGAVTLDNLAEALEKPARPLFLGRKSCPPSGRLLQGVVHAETPLEALLRMPLEADEVAGTRRVWFGEDQAEPQEGDRVEETWQRRNYRTTRFDAKSRMVERRMEVREVEET